MSSRHQLIDSYEISNTETIHFHPLPAPDPFVMLPWHHYLKMPGLSSQAASGSPQKREAALSKPASNIAKQ